MADNLVIRIRDFDPIKGAPGYYTMKVRQVTAVNGDIDLPAEANGAQVKFKLADSLTTGDTVYQFKNSPVCVYHAATDTSCNPGEGVNNNSGWEASPVVNGNSFTLTVPPAANAPGEYEYSLFLRKTKDGQNSPVTVDPRIKNGGVALNGYSMADSDGFSLAFLAFLTLSLGFVLGWVIKGTRQP